MTEVTTLDKESKVIGLQWRWILIGLFFGFIATFLSIDLVSPNYPGTIIPIFIVMVIGFCVMGIFVGYLSPGVTIKEASVSGVLMIILFVIYFILAGKMEYIPAYYVIFAFVLGYIFSLLGGWIGEILQAEDKTKKTGLQWNWIVVGVILGFLVSNLLLLILAPRYNEKTVLYLLSIGFIITGFFTGWRSPGVTILEAAIAGAITVILDYLFLIFITMLNIPIFVFQEPTANPNVLILKITFVQVIFGFVIGLVLALLGGFIGEAFQKRMESAK